MSWREKSAKYAIIISDAPCHGIKYFKSFNVNGGGASLYFLSSGY